MVKEACHKFAFSYLLEQKNKLSKGKQIVYYKLETQEYLKPGSGLSQDDMKQIYLLRTQNILVKSNFPGMFKDVKCVSEFCSEEESARHIFYCKHLEDENAKCLMTRNIKFDDIFSNNIKSQLTVKNIFMKKFKKRNEMLSSS